MVQAQKCWVHQKHPHHSFKVRDQVWLEGWNLRIDQPSIKLAAKHQGPFPISQVLSPIMYQLKLPLTWKIHPVFHVDLLTPYKEMEVHGTNFPKPPPDLIDGEEEYKVERILDSQHYGRYQKVQYLVKWKGYPESNNQWVNWDNMFADEALQEYRQQYPTAITHIKKASTTTEVPSMEFTSTPSPPPQDLYELTLPSHLASPASSPSPVPTTSFDDALYMNLQPATASQKDLAINLQSSHARVGQLVEEVSQLLSQANPDQVQVNDASGSVDPKITIASEVVRTTTVPHRPATPYHSISSPSVLLHTLPYARTPESSSPSPRLHPPPLIPVWQALLGLHNLGPLSLYGQGSSDSYHTLPSTTSTLTLAPSFVSATSTTTTTIQGDSEETSLVSSVGSEPTTEAVSENPGPDPLIDRGNSLTPPPPGFHFNQGREYIPFLIKQDGVNWLVKYMQVVMTSDPYTIGMRAGDVSFYSGWLTVQPVRDLTHPVKYTHDDFIFFKDGFVGWGVVDMSLEELGDLSLKVEVHRYWCACAEIACIQHEIDALQGRRYMAVSIKDGSMMHLEEADAMQCIEEQTNSHMIDMMRCFEDQVCRRSSWKGGDVMFWLGTSPRVVVT